MSEWISIIILGLIEGVTEFLPVSSTGHLLLVENLGWVPRQSDLFNTVVQCGAVVAVLAVFAERVKQLATNIKDAKNLDFTLKLGTAFLVTCIGGVILKKFGFRLPAEAAPVAWATLIGGIAILVIERLLRNKELKPDISWQVAIGVGLAQLLAGAFPGTSRSGATILFALAMGVTRPLATEFSFLLGIPTLFAAGALELWSERHNFHSINFVHLALGTTVSAIMAFIVVKWLLRYVQTHTFNLFGWYRIGLGLVILILLIK